MKIELQPSKIGLMDDWMVGWMRSGSSLYPTIQKSIHPSIRLCFCLLLFCQLAAVRVSAQTNLHQIYLQCLTNFETYAETIWHTSGSIPDSGYWGDGGSTGNGGIRGNGGVAVAYAVLALALPNDPKFTNRIARVRQALNYDYNTHVTGSYNTTSGNQWGWSGVSTDWQTPEWSGSMGLACILMQSNLPAATVNGVPPLVGHGPRPSGRERSEPSRGRRAGVPPRLGHGGGRNCVAGQHPRARRRLDEHEQQFHHLVQCREKLSRQHLYGQQFRRRSAGKLDYD